VYTFTAVPLVRAVHICSADEIAKLVITNSVGNIVSFICHNEVKRTVDGTVLLIFIFIFFLIILLFYFW